ncbi:MAG TPA: tetratricopeptide repeat protein [Verrucomicrobiae bacterium]|nr:tetratricopeptide repeat protein [Verrucomicrobiae bacterium]
MSDKTKLIRNLTIIGVCLLLGAFGLIIKWPRHQTTAEAPKLSAGELSALIAKAEQNDASAQTALGSAYALGNGVKQDYRQAATWYQRAAAQGSTVAQNALGELSEAGQGVPQDNAQAANWYRRAAEHGLATAQYNLAALYAVGRGVTLDNREALKWYLQAANQGDSLAQYNVGMRYSEGHGVAPDLAVAYQWLSLSAAQGLPDASQALAALKSRMSSEQLSRGRELLRSFKPQTMSAASH